MKIYDISQPIPGCALYPGDPEPRLQLLQSTDRGDLYNLTAFSMCAHNGTHLDAPRHFLPEGQTVGELDLSKTVGPACVLDWTGPIGAEEAESLLGRLDGVRKLLLRGDSLVTTEAAAVFAAAKLDLIGVESQSVGPEDAPMAVHKLLLGAGILLLEGLRLQAVPPGTYLLCAQPLNLTPADGAPCRAILLEL
jgi:arylformamidase